MILIQIQQEFFLYRPVNTDKPNFVSFVYLLVQLLHLPLKFHLSKVSRNQKPFWIPCQNSEYARIFRVTEANQNAHNQNIYLQEVSKKLDLFACLRVSKDLRTLCCQYLSQNSDSSFLFLRSFVCLPQFISIQSRQTANYLSCYKIHI